MIICADNRIDHSCLGLNRIDLGFGSGVVSGVVVSGVVVNGVVENGVDGLEGSGIGHACS